MRDWGPALAVCVGWGLFLGLIAAGVVAAMVWLT